ncbi:Protein phosphatase 2C family protein [Rhynchospora pubera]|uniref:protein-serine/threonine phosphatase n=1 Tax=Rhynchospora pubera TaxID=906938 RepID=A0AAV8C1G9_9POAL|nr:Protein phosphatase 2C family protein [Rhynchospora pubera]
MEDAVMVELAFTRTASEFACSHEYDFFAVYDGHGGSQVANACRERIHLIVAEEVARRWPMIESEFGCWENTMVESFRRLDAEVGANKEPIQYDRIEPDFRETVGSTALTVVVGKKRIIVANCGVSRAVLSRGGTTVALSSDHKEFSVLPVPGEVAVPLEVTIPVGIQLRKLFSGLPYQLGYRVLPNRPDEMQRIEAAGGKVIESDGYRVWGVLNNSRSIGDHKLKAYVICEPEVTITERVLEDEFIILASDGLWDVISNEMACGIVRSCLFAGPTPTDVASLLVKIAISRGSRDNISVIVVQLTTAMQS